MTDPFSGVATFVRVADRKSFTAAARQLGVTTAAVSKVIRGLEERLGVTLLLRTSRAVALTPEGTAFFERCRHALDQVQAGTELVAREHRMAEGPVRLSLSPIVARLVVSELPALARLYPAMTFELAVTDRFTGLVEERIDVAVRIGELHDSALRSRILAQPRWVTVASPAYLSERGFPATPSQLATHHCLVFVTPRGTLREWQFRDERGQSCLFRPPIIRLRIDNGEILMTAALAGLGICQVMDFMAARHVREGRLVEVLAPFGAESLTIRALWVARRRETPKVRVMVDLLATLFAREVIDLRPER